MFLVEISADQRSSNLLPRKPSMPHFRHWCFPIAFAAVSSVCFAQDGVLQLANGGALPGALQISAEPGLIRWRSPLFVRPFEFPVAGVNTVSYPVTKARVQPAGEYCFELNAGDVIYGDLVTLNDKVAVVEVAPLGRIHLERDQIQRLYRWQTGADLVYVGPNGLVGWKEAPSAGEWREEAGQLWTDRAGASLCGDFGLPPQAVVEFEISWKAKPDFVLALGVSLDDEDLTYKRSHRFEIWDEELVVRCELGNEADVDSVDAVGAGKGRAHYQACLDQIHGRLLVYSPNGGKRAQLSLPPRKPAAHTGLRLTNKRGDVRLERLRITRWDGRDPQALDLGESRAASHWAVAHRHDGKLVQGNLLSYDATQHRFVIRDDNGEQRVPADEIASLYLSPRSDIQPRSVRVVYQDGTRLSGELLRVDEARLQFHHPAVLQELSLPRENLQALVGLKEKPTAPQETVEGRAGRLELEGVTLAGRLTNGRKQPDASCLAWHPDISRVASPLRPGVSGRIVYRESPPPPRMVQANAQATTRQLGFVDAFSQGLSRNPAPTTPSGAARTLHLRSGDTIPCTVSRIDESGVHMQTAMSDATFVAHDKIKALELVPGLGAPRINKLKQDRLLTLPRLQKDSPPTHLIRSENGDILRARLVGMDETLARVEVRLDETTIPRSRIAQIIWLHADELDEAGTPATANENPPSQPPAGEDGAMRVQALDRQGVRLTFFAEEVAGSILSGTSDVLGPCRVDLEQVDQLLLSSAIDKAAAELAYHQWRLHPAIEPKIAQDFPVDSPGGLSGTESSLVGKPAPDFNLDLLAGGKFRLADAKGQVVVLDFWATWCGPCLQAMPLVDDVVDEFRDQGVRLVAVNLEEAPAQIRATLERHKLDVEVALDRDGVAALKYQAVAIPQTVIIDREGKVARLFVGGGPQLADSLREALRAVLAGP
jgi:thiol-disulfide isomerase/thioredoxin